MSSAMIRVLLTGCTDCWSRFKQSHGLVIFALILLIFLIAANLAWLNPRPDFVIKTSQKIPLLWQYNRDSPTEFLSAAYFPEFFRTQEVRINRPMYPFAAHMIGKIVGIIARPIAPLDDLERAMIGYILLKNLVYFIGAILLYRISLQYLDEKMAILGLSLVFLHQFSILSMATFHTGELQFITPIIVVFLFLRLVKNYSTIKNFVFSFMIGTLMLAKQNYAIYIAILLYSLLIHKAFKEVFISVLSHLVPLGMWISFLHWYGLQYYNHEVEVYRQGVWLFEDLIFRNPIDILQTILLSIRDWLTACVQYFTIFLFLAIFALAYPNIRERFKKEEAVFVLCFIVFSWLQSLAAQRYFPNMSSDLSFIVFPLAAGPIIALLRTCRLERYAIVFVALYLFFNTITFIHLPWIHPYNQVDVFGDKFSR